MIAYGRDFLSEDGTHPSREKVLRYVMPHLAAKYTAGGIEKTKWQGDYPVCQVCGRTDRDCEVHHEPPRSEDVLDFHTEMGIFTIRPALILLCKECHADRHSRGELEFNWVFDTEEDELKFWEGWYFSHFFNEHDERFWNHGRIVVNSRGMEWEVRR